MELCLMHPFVEFTTATHRLLYISSIAVNRTPEGNYSQIILKSIWIMTNIFGQSYTKMKFQIHPCASLALFQKFQICSRTFQNIGYCPLLSVIVKIYSSFVVSPRDSRQLLSVIEDLLGSYCQLLKTY